ncbi:hypothetical protein BD289DRAFT_286230 [Coniella lustricola]|uniref:Uncharacterized protein n=1 Tax=Coniella lustricola TaxID=2025994 RepID=A0A2T3A5K2_9PEZI|nr:hypothetical protein BD289DRAFT_286230 [Coniella lustricola]
MIDVPTSPGPADRQCMPMSNRGGVQGCWRVLEGVWKGQLRACWRKRVRRGLAWAGRLGREGERRLISAVGYREADLILRPSALSGAAARLQSGPLAEMIVWYLVESRWRPLGDCDGESGDGPASLDRQDQHGEGDGNWNNRQSGWFDDQIHSNISRDWDWDWGWVRQQRSCCWCRRSGGGGGGGRQRRRVTRVTKQRQDVQPPPGLSVAERGCSRGMAALAQGRQQARAPASHGPSCPNWPGPRVGCGARGFLSLAATAATVLSAGHLFQRV